MRTASTQRRLSPALLVLMTACMLLFSQSVFAQDFTITGTMTSATDGRPLAGASVVEVGTTTGTSTDQSGRYTLEVSSPNAQITVSFIGFLSQTIGVNNRATIDVVLEEDVGQMEEVVVTA